MDGKLSSHRKNGTDLSFLVITEQINVLTFVLLEAVLLTGSPLSLSIP